MRAVLDVTPLIGRPTGVGVFVEGLLDALIARGDVEVGGFALTARSHGVVSGLLQSRIGPSVRGQSLPMPAAALTRVWKKLSVPWAELWTGATDVVHGTNFVCPPARTAAMLVTVHDLTAIRFPELCTPQTLNYPALIQKAIARGAHVHVLSDAIKNEVLEYFDVNTDRVHRIYPGILRHEYYGSRELDNSRKYIVSIGTIEPRKDFPTLIRSFDRIAETDSEIELVIVGASGWGSEDFNEALKRAKYRDRVTVTGWVENEVRQSLLCGARALVYPSMYEGFGIPPLEAMQAGIPVLATASPAVAEVVGDAGYLVPVGDSEALANAIVEVIGDTQMRNSLIAKGAQRIKNFSWDNTAKEMVNLYKAISK